MSCGCSRLEDGKAIVDHVRNKGKEKLKPRVTHRIACECGDLFTMETVVMNCPGCGMTYGVTPCSSGDSKKIKAAGIQYL